MMEPGRGRLHFSIPHWTLGSCPVSLCSGDVPAGGSLLWLWLWGRGGEGREQVPRVRVNLHLCVTQGRITGGAQGP